jgi:hypothetical protein
MTAGHRETDTKQADRRREGDGEGKRRKGERLKGKERQIEYKQTEKGRRVWIG